MTKIVVVHYDKIADSLQLEGDTDTIIGVKTGGCFLSHPFLFLSFCPFFPSFPFL